MPGLASMATALSAVPAAAPSAAPAAPKSERELGVGVRRLLSLWYNFPTAAPTPQSVTTR